MPHEENHATILAKDKYLDKDILYLKNRNIVEYDMKSAGFSIVKNKRLVHDEMLDRLSRLTNKQRNILIGKLQAGNRHFTKTLIGSFAEIRCEFGRLNELYNENILAVKKDAIFTIDVDAKNLLVFDAYQFDNKNNYTSYLYANRCEFFYSADRDVLDVKGISDVTREKQHDYLLNDIKNLLAKAEILNPEARYKMLKRYREQYLNRELPYQTYRCLSSGYYKLTTTECMLEECPLDNIDDIDITDNYRDFILPLIQNLL